MATNAHHLDPRRRRTREALLSAFVLLALRRRYHEIRIDDLLEASGVGRSTFYEHFAGKDALLAASLGDALWLLAGVPVGRSTPPQLAMLLDHFWHNRAMVPGIFQGAAHRVVRNALVRRVEDALQHGGGARLRLPRRLAAHLLADGLLSPIVAWLAGEAACSGGDFAIALHDASRATFASLQIAGPA
jgi:AcrR family transcriptional regulator